MELDEHDWRRYVDEITTATLDERKYMVADPHTPLPFLSTIKAKVDVQLKEWRTLLRGAHPCAPAGTEFIK